MFTQPCSMLRPFRQSQRRQPIDKRLDMNRIGIVFNAEVESSLVGLPDFKSGVPG